MIDSTIRDPITGNTTRVSATGSVQVSIGPAERREGKNRTTLYSQLLGSAGATTGLTTGNLNVDGSVTPQRYYIGSEQAVDINITRIVIVIADTAIVHNRFGNENPLAVGFDLNVTERGLETKLINKAKTGGELIAQSGVFAPFGTGAESFELVNWTGTEDAQIIVFNLEAIIPGGIRIAEGTPNRITAVVNDNLTGLTEFSIRAFGWRLHA